MTEKQTKPKPNATYRRKKVSRRRLGRDAKCAYCGETRPEALIPGSKPRSCYACRRRSQGKSEIDLHHVAGQNNHAGTVPVHVNDHRAHLNAAQYNWPLKTLRNPDGSPLLATAGCIRGFIDFNEHFIDEFLRPNAELLETLNARLVEKFGTHWWVEGESEQDNDEVNPK